MVYGQTSLVHFQVIDKTIGKLTPARLTILKDGKPIALSLESKLNIATRNNVINTASGTATFSLEAGDYEFWFSKGMEYTIDVQKVSLKNKEEYFLSAYLERAINTDGFICGDLHLHTLTNSGPWRCQPDRTGNLLCWGRIGMGGSNRPQFYYRLSTLYGSSRVEWYNENNCWK